MKQFKDIPEILEVECSGMHLEAEETLLSLTLFTVPGNSVLGHVNPLTNKCLTFEVFASCSVDSSDTKKTRLKVLVYDLKEAEIRKYGCNCSSFRAIKETEKVTWYIQIMASSRFFHCLHSYFIIFKH